MTAVVSFSGGQDSTTCLFAALQDHDEVHAVSFYYNQRHKREIAAAEAVISYAQVRYPGKTIKHHVKILPSDMLASDSPLTSDNALETYESKEQMDKVIGDRVEVTFIPGRNLLFAALLVPIASRVGASDIYLGVCEADGSNYNDCTEAFVNALQDVIIEALPVTTAVVTPLLHRTKAQSLEYALTLPGCFEALAYSHTAYSGEYPPVTQDHATVLRASGFEEAGLADPLLVRAWQEGLLTERPPGLPEGVEGLSAYLDSVGVVAR